jgi:hypothetical protein
MAATVIRLLGAKGGQGTSTTAAALAVLASQSGLRTALASAQPDDITAILGVPPGTAGEVAPGLLLDDELEAFDVELVVIDGDVHEALEVDTTFLVLRPCYLSLRRWMAQPAPVDAFILITEAGRALDASDVASVLGLPLAAEIMAQADIARAMDAGVLLHRVPTELRRSLKKLVPEKLSQTGGTIQ